MASDDAKHTKRTAEPAADSAVENADNNNDDDAPDTTVTGTKKQTKAIVNPKAAFEELFGPNNTVLPHMLRRAVLLGIRQKKGKLSKNCMKTIESECTTKRKKEEFLEKHAVELQRQSKRLNVYSDKVVAGAEKVGRAVGKTYSEIVFAETLEPPARAAPTKIRRANIDGAAMGNPSVVAKKKHDQKQKKEKPAAAEKKQTTKKKPAVGKKPAAAKKTKTVSPRGAPKKRASAAGDGAALPKKKAKRSEPKTT
jgi:hypothetical protein